MQGEGKDGAGVACPLASTPLGTALSDFAGRNPSEIPSQTQSVSAFLPGKVSMGTPFLRLMRSYWERGGRENELALPCFS
jgi:hypothetical protein